MERSLRWSRAAVGMVFAVLFLAPILAGGFDPAPAALLRVFLLLATWLFLTYAYVHGELFFLKSPLSLPILVYLALSALTLLWSISRYATLIALYDLIAYALLFFLLVNLIVTRSRVSWLVGILGAATAWVCISGIQNYFLLQVNAWREQVDAGILARSFSSFVQFLMTSPPEWRAFGPFFNPNIFAHFLIIAIPVTLARYMLSEERAHAMAFGFLLILELIALMLTASKGAWMALIVAAGIFGLLAWLARAHLGPRPLGRLLQIGLILILLGGIFARPILLRLEAATTTEAHSGQFRLYLWRSTLDLIAHHPFGTGLGTFELAYPKYALVGYTRMAHNGYLQIAAEGGLPALLAFLWILGALGWVIYQAIVAHRRESPPRHASVPLLNVGFASAVAASCLHSLVDFAWSVPATAIAFWMALGMSAATTGIAPPRVYRFGRAAWLAGSLLLLILALAMALPGLSSLYSGLAAQAEAERNFGEALIYQRQALALDPLNPDNHLRLARLLPQSGMIGGAREEIRAAIAGAPTNSRYYVTLGALEEMAGDPDAARRAYRMAVRIEPNSTALWRQLAEFSEKQGERAEALKAWRRIIEIERSPAGRWQALPELVDVNFARAHRALAAEAMARSRPEEAIPHLRRAAEIMASYEENMKKFGPVLESVGQYGPQQAAEMRGLREEVLREWANAYRAARQPEKARRVLEQLRSLEPLESPAAR